MSNPTVIFIWIGCLTPSILLNLWPRLVAPTSGNLVMVALQIICITGAAMIPVALEARKGSLGERVIGWAMWVGLITICLYFALEGSASLRDAVSAGARNEIAASASNTTRLAELRASRSALGEFVPTSEPALTIAQAGSGAAQKARDDECSVRGPQCRSRETELAAAMETWRKAAVAREATVRAKELDVEIGELSKSQGSATPRHADQSAARAAMILSKVGIKVDELAVVDWVPIFIAGIFEMFAGLGPYVLIPRSKKCPPIAAIRREKPMAVPLRANGNKCPPEHPVEKWYRTQAKVSVGNEMAAGEAHEHYVRWCEKYQHKPIGPQVFSRIMKRKLSVPFKMRSGKVFYTIVVVGQLRVVPSTSLNTARTRKASM